MGLASGHSYGPAELERHRHQGSAAAAAGACLLLLLSLAGATILAWWTLEFHRSNERLWMVPVGLVMLGTPAITCLSVVASGGRRAGPAAAENEAQMSLDLEK